MRKTWRRRQLILALKLFAAIVVIWALVAYGTLDLAALRAAAASPIALAIVTCLLLLNYILSAYRWRLLLKCQSVNITIHEATSVTFFTLFIGSFLPGGMVAGDAARIAYVVKIFPAKKAIAVMSIFVDRLIGLYSMLLVCCVVALLNPAGIASSAPLHFLATTAGVLFLAASAGLMVLYVGLKKAAPRLRGFMEAVPHGLLAYIAHRIIGALWLYRRASRSLLAALGISVIAFAIGVACVMIIGYSMQLGPLAPIDYGFAAPWAWLANLLPVTPGGLGVGEAAFDRICHWLEASQTAAAYGTIFLVYRIVAIVATLPGLAVYLFHRDTFKLPARSSNDN